jgi:CheY-like chemotaxis protein
VESKVGKGSTFTLTLPWEPVIEVAAPDAAPSAAQQRAEVVPTQTRVLLVEDNLVNQKVVLAILRKKGFQIDVSNDGREALSKLEAAADPYDIILMDVQMPVLDGLETTRIIRKNQRWDRLPIVAMTAHAMNGDRERCLQAGMNSYVSKPVQPAHLVSVIEKLLQEWAAAPEPPLTVSGRLVLEHSEMANDLLELFLQLAPERLLQMETAASQGDGHTLAAEARKIADAASQFASRAVADCAHRLELAAANRNFAKAAEELVTLHREIQELSALV